MALNTAECLQPNGAITIWTFTAERGRGPASMFPRHHFTKLSPHVDISELLIVHFIHQFGRIFDQDTVKKGRITRPVPLLAN